MEWQKVSISFDLMLSRNKLWGRTIVLHCRVEAWPIFLITNSFIFPKSFRISLANWEDHVPMAPIAYVIAFAMTERCPTTSLVSAKAGSPDHLVISLPDLAIFIQSSCPGMFLTRNFPETGSILLNYSTETWWTQKLREGKGERGKSWERGFHINSLQPLSR